MRNPEQKELRSEDHHSSPLNWILPAVSAGLVNGILILIFQSAYAALIFSGDLSGYVARGIGFMLFGAFLMGTVVALTSSFRGTVTAPQDAPTAIMALISAGIAAALHASTAGHDVFITVVAAMALTALLTGLFLLALGWFRLGNLIRFIPYPVVGGFLAGTGWILVKGAIRIMSGVKPSFSQIFDLFQIGVLLKWLPGLAFAFLLFFALRRFRNFLTMPLMIFGAIVLFYLVVYLTGTSLKRASEEGWLLAQFTGGISWQPSALYSLPHINWPAILGQAGNIGTIVFISIISLLLNSSGLELIARREVDLNRELRSAGLANFLAGLGGSSAGYMSLSLTALGHRIGSRSRLSALISAGMCGVTLLSGAGISSYFPKPLLGGLLFYLGLSFLVEWLYKSWFKLPRTEYLLVVLILVTIAVFGFLQGMAVGILIAAVEFVVNYSRINVIKHALTGATYQSNVDRAPAYQRLLREHGEQLYILKLQGYLFFGTANNLLDQVKQRAHAPNQPPLRFVVLDFRLVTGLDSSALNSFAKMKMLLEETLEIHLLLTGLSPALERQFETGGLAGKDPRSLLMFPDLDHGVEWCENRMLLALTASAGESGLDKHDAEFLEAMLDLSSRPLETAEFARLLTSRILPYFEKREIDPGSYLIRQGNPPVGIYMIESGQITVRLEEASGSIVRLRTMGAGTVVGELGMYLGLPATASVVTDQQCTVWYLSAENLKKMEETDPRAAASFHKFVACILGERLANSNKTLQALLD